MLVVVATASTFAGEISPRRRTEQNKSLCWLCKPLCVIEYSVPFIGWKNVPKSQSCGHVIVDGALVVSLEAFEWKSREFKQGDFK